MFANNYKELAKTNTNFRKVLFTGHHSQLVAMSLPADIDIGEEVHPDTDQIFFLIEGEGEAMVDGETRQVAKKDLVYVPAGMLHNIINTGSDSLKLLTIYCPAHHPDGTIHATKEQAMIAEHMHHDKSEGK